GIPERQDFLDRSFKEGKLGLQVSGAWLFKSIPRDAPGLRYGVALVPRPERRRRTHASLPRGDGAALPATALTRPRGARGVQRAAVGAATMAWYRDHPEEALMTRQFETAVPTPNH